MKNIFFLSLLVLMFASCKRQNMVRSANTRSLGKADPASKPYSTLPPGFTPAGADQPAVPVLAEQTTAVNTEQNYRFIVSFFSVSAGPDNEGMRAFDDWVARYSEKRGIQIKYEKTSWGREGETEYCFLLNEMTPAEQTEFVASAREQLKSASRVNTYENQPCKHLKKP